MSSSNGTPTRSLDRTPFRSLQNEMQHFSTPSTSPAIGDATNTMKSNALACAQQQSSEKCSPKDKDASYYNLTGQVPPVPIGTPEAEVGDVTFKSFNCAGAEIEISEHSVVAEDVFNIPENQALKNRCLKEDTVVSDSMMSQSWNCHMEHPYCSLETGAGTVNLNTGSCLDDTGAKQDSVMSQNTCCRGADVTIKSFFCNGGEVEVLDTTSRADATIPLPRPELVEHLPSDDVNLSVTLDDYGQRCKEDHADHPYCSGERGIPYSVTRSPEAANGQGDITLKSFVCAWGEVEVSGDTKPADDTVPLPSVQFGNITVEWNESVNKSALAGDHHTGPFKDHAEHPYCNSEKPLSYPSGPHPAVEELSASACDYVEVDEQNILVTSGGNAEVFSNPSICELSEVNLSGATRGSEKTDFLPGNHAAIMCDHNQGQLKPPSGTMETGGVECPTDKHTSTMGNASAELINSAGALKLDLLHHEDNGVHSELPHTEASDGREDVTPVKVLGRVNHKSNLHSRSGAPDISQGSAGYDPVFGESDTRTHSENLLTVSTPVPKFPGVEQTFQFELHTPVMRGTPLARVQAYKDSPLARFLAHRPVVGRERATATPADPFAGPLESPMPEPCFNSTVLASGRQKTPVVVRETAEQLTVEAPSAPPLGDQINILDIPLIPNGPLQQQLRQMAEFLMLASGKVGTAAAPAPGPVAPAPAHTSQTGSSTANTPAESVSVCVGTTPVKLVEHSVNTSGQFEKKWEISVADSCTITNPLLWSVPPGSLEGLPRPELEQRLRSSMILVEALAQQLDSARVQRHPAAGPAPSELRDVLVQTDHTELSQTTTYRDLYVEALGRIKEMELDKGCQQSLIQSMQDSKIAMTALSADTGSALADMKQMEELFRDDYCSLITQYAEMKTLCQRFKEAQVRMAQKVRHTLQEREDMRQRRDEASTAKEAAFSVLEQLRVHSAQQISKLEESVGSHQELMAALITTHSEQVALNEAYVESLNTASGVLTRATRDQASLTEELRAVWSLVQKTNPMLLKLNEKAAAAHRERDEHLQARDRAVEERQQIQEELDQANLDLQDARHHIGDLDIQVTIMTTEMGVLRQKLSEGEEECAQLERKVTELSATIDSTLHSYTFLEQTLAATTTKLEQSWKDVQVANERADGLEASLTQSQQSECELSDALSRSSQELEQLQTLSHTQSVRIQQLQDTRTQLNSVTEMNEFLQIEYELLREQMAESESTLRANLQGLRERNIECEDLKGALAKLQLEKLALQEEADATRQNLGEQLAQAVSDITVLHHTLRGLTDELHTALHGEKRESSVDRAQQTPTGPACNPPSSSFVDGVMFALMAAKGEEGTKKTPAEQDVPQFEGLLSQRSAFTRIVHITPEEEARADPEEEDNNVPELLADLGDTVSELVSTLKSLQQHKDTELRELQNTILGLQGAQQAAASAHQDEVRELRAQLSRLGSQVERGNQALQQKAQDEKTLMQLIAEVSQAQELLNKHNADNNVLRKEVSELRHTAQKSQVESKALWEELKKAGSASANQTQFMNEKIQLLGEVASLKENLQDANETRARLLERAKRHQMIHQSNQQKMEKELLTLDHMIDTVRKALLSVPDVVNSCRELKQLADYIG